MKTEVPLYFFILGLTPLLGVSHSFIHSVLLSGVLLMLLLVQGPLLSLVGYRLSDRARLPALFFLNLLLVTGTDFFFQTSFPALYPGFGIYLKLMAFNPLILKILADQARGWDLRESLTYALKSFLGFLLTGMVLSGFREILGAGRLSYGLGGEVWLIPLLEDHSFRFLFAGGSGALILAGLLKAFQNWGYRQGWLWLKQEEPRSGRPTPEESRKGPSPAPVKPVEVPVPPPVARVHREEPPVSAPETGSPERAPAQVPDSEVSTPEVPVREVSSPEVDSRPADWGESPRSLLDSLGSGREFEKNRLLVIGCGTGEEVYKTAMVLADAKRSNPRFSFRIRGVDSFAARIDQAKEGVYRDLQLEEVSLERKQRYLLQNRDEGHRLLRIGQDLRQYVEFLVSDYLGPGYFFQKPCDLITVSQEMDFMTAEERTKFLGLIQEHLSPQGALILPENWPRETIPGGFRRTGSRVYRKD